MLPYLFLLCAEGLVHLIRRSGREGSLQGFSVLKSGPKVSQLFFADDCLLFGRAKRRDCIELMDILKLYGRASRQEVNASKFGILYSKNTKEDDRKSTMEILGIHRPLE